MKNLLTKFYIFFIMLTPVMANAQVQKLSSNGPASATLFLDFDGHFVQSAGWNGGNAFYCQPTNFTAAQVDEVFSRVSEDFRPFDINVTTDSTQFQAAPLNRRMRIIVTPTSSWYPVAVGGVSYVGSFTWGDNTPGFVFADKLGYSVKYVSECISHESGHTVGLSHQSKYDGNCNLTEQYNVGNGTGETGWAPVMGNSYYRNMTGWNDGPTPYGCANTQDNLTIITTSNGFGYRADDYPATRNSATFSLGSAAFSEKGIITNNTDKDAFRYIVPQSTSFHMDVNPFSIGNNAGANLDVMVEMYDGSNNLLRTFNPITSLSVTIDTFLNAGTYYFVVSGASNQNINNYGSLGSYSITGFKGALAIHDITLTGNADKTQHRLNWNIVADEPIKEQTVEISMDGQNFKALVAINALQKSFLNTANQNNIIYYRLKVTSVINQTAYSNVVALRSSASETKPFTVSTLVQNEITVQAAEDYHYYLTDANGRMIARGAGVRGSHKINVATQAGGMYILQLANNNNQQIERIIKQ